MWPGLYFDEATIGEFRKRVDGDPFLRDGWERFLARGAALLEEDLVPESVAEAGSGQHGNYGAPARQVVAMGETLGFLYRVTGDRRYADALRRALLHYGGYERWGGRAFFTWDPPWHSELNTAHFCQGYAAGYDAIRSVLSPDERKAITGAMVRLGIRPTLDDWLDGRRRIHALDSMGHNWWSVCVGGAGVAALALVGDHPDAGAWAREVARAYPFWFDYRGNVLQNKPVSFDRSGGFYEGVGYAGYGLLHFVYFREAYERVLGPCEELRRIPALSRMGEFFIYTFYPTGDGWMTANFGDQSLHGSVPGPVILDLARRGDDPRLRWTYRRVARHPGSLHELLWYRPGGEGGPDDLPRSRIWPDIGWAILRDRWGSSGTLLATRCGDTWGHAHADAGSFILWSRGEPLAIDSGTCSYGRREYTAYYRQSRAHNVVLFEGEGEHPEHIERGSPVAGRLHDLMDGDGARYVLADSTGPFARERSYRSFIWLDRTIIIVDDIRTATAGRFEWLLHHGGTVSRDQGRILVANGDARLEVKTLHPRPVRIEEREGFEDGRPDEKRSYLAIAREGSAGDAHFIHSLVPLEDGEVPPEITPVEGREWIGARIRDGRAETRVYLNLRADGRRMHRNSNNVIEGWETDAYLLAVTYSRHRASSPAVPRGEAGAELGSSTRYSPARFGGVRMAEELPVWARSEGGGDPGGVVESERQSPRGKGPARQPCRIVTGDIEPSRLVVISCSYLRYRGQVVLDSLSKVCAILSPGEEYRLWLSGQPTMDLRLGSPVKPRRVFLGGEPVPHGFDGEQIRVRVSSPSAGSSGKARPTGSRTAARVSLEARPSGS